MKTVYLCGPINGCTDSECRDWREYVKDRWEGSTLVVADAAARISPWMRYHSHKICSSFEDAMAFIKEAVQ